MPSIFEMSLSPQNIICLDVEFNDLTTPELMSLGLASGTGAEHYAELDLENPASAGVLSRCSDAVLHGDVVLTQWGSMPGCAGTFAQMAKRTADWLSAEAGRVQERSGQPALVAFDYPPDFALLVQLLQDHGHWARMQPLVEPLNVDELTCRFDASLAADAAFQQLRRRGLERHHALADALALRAAVHAAITGKRLSL